MPELVALHSSQSHGGQWRNVAKALSATQQSLLSPDLVGYGQSGHFTDTARGFRFADELAHLNSKGVHFSAQTPTLLLGHSYGGALALHIALKYPQAVSGLILYEPVSFHVLPEHHTARDEIVQVADAMSSMSQASACRHFVDYWNTPGYFDRLPNAAKRMMIAQQGKVEADFEALLRQPTALAEYQAIECPVVLFVGNDSPQSSRTVASQLATVLPRVTIKQVAAGHMGPLTHHRVVTPEFVQAIAQLQGKL